MELKVVRVLIEEPKMEEATINIASDITWDIGTEKA